MVVEADDAVPQFSQLFACPRLGGAVFQDALPPCFAEGGWDGCFDGFGEDGVASPSVRRIVWDELIIIIGLLGFISGNLTYFFIHLPPGKER